VSEDQRRKKLCYGIYEGRTSGYDAVEIPASVIEAQHRETVEERAEAAGTFDVDGREYMKEEVAVAIADARNKAKWRKANTRAAHENVAARRVDSHSAL
jgi:hypothetical protein